ncbi:type II toxin-antitoxin system RelE/ParE family toxin [Candidatus Microgenomates bacterium]|nr:type II toxin-antitoxin system RelE/ParE family toxin [Candidatus Microgenomates bacterium]
MDKSWNIIYYQAFGQDKSSVYSFINSLNPKLKAKVINILDLLMEKGPNLRLPHSRKLVGTDLWELRTLGNGNIRIFYVFINGNFILLHAFSKKKQKTDRREIRIAAARLREYKTQ